MSAPALILRGVTKRFGATIAVKGLDLEVPAGCMCGVLGPNGAGKSTTIRMLMSIIRPDSGQILVLGRDALDMKDRIGYLPEERGIYRRMRVMEYLRYIAQLKGVPRRVCAARVAAWLERIELPGVGKMRCEELSKGMQQKVQFVAAVVHDPELIVLDEPFSGLDPVNARVLLDTVRALHASGRTILFSTHQMHQAEQLCERVVLINRGEKILDATMEEVSTTFDPRGILVEPEGDADSARDALSRMPGVIAAEIAPDGRSVLVAADDDHDAGAMMRAALDTVRCRRVERRRTSLDEVFVRLVTEHGGHMRYATREATHA
jgi:ABC-2 type transport system ATP-binding protein